MLILTRRPVEKIMMQLPIGLVEVIVLGVKGNQVRIGFVAPKELEIHRQEYYEFLKQERLGGPSGEAEPNGNC